MSIPTTQALRSLLSLAEKREALQAELAKIDSQLEATLAGKAAEPVITPSKAPKAPKAAKPAKAKQTGKRGVLKDLIVEALHTAGDAGVAVKDLATQLGKKTQNIHVWFATTGKTVGATKVSPGVFALGKPSTAAAPKEEAPAKPVKAKKAKGPKKSAKKP